MPPRVSSYMNSSLITVSLTDTLAHARRLMLRYGIGRLPVIDENERLVGILTVSDITDILSGRLTSKGLGEIMVKEVYTPDPITIEPTRSIKTAAQLMLKYKIGGLPVIDYSENLVGIITRSDLVKAYSERYREEFIVSDFMRKEYAKARRDHNLYYVLKLMSVDPAGKVIIEENEKPVGVIAKRDLAFIATIPLPKGGKKRRVYKIREMNPIRNRIITTRIYLAPIAEDIMTPNPITVKPNEDLASAAEIMSKEGIGILPVVNENITIGVITKLEILKAITVA